MSLSESVAARRAAKLAKRSTCVFAAIRQQLPPDELAALDRMLADVNYDATDIAAGLTDEGYAIGYSTVARHRRRGEAGGCKCP